MTERTRENRFDEVYQIVLIVVALSFDVIWFFGRVPAAEIAVFIFVLFLWAYGNLKGGAWEYSFKLASFNLSITLLTNFYIVSLFGEVELSVLWKVILGALILPLTCLGITLVLVSYLKESIDREVLYPLLLGGTLGYIISMIFAITLIPP